MGDDSRQHFNNRLQALNTEWEREAVCNRAGIEALRLMDFEKNRWPRLYAYLTAGETKEMFDALVIGDAAGRIKFQHGAVPDDLSIVIDPVKRWFHSKTGEKVYRVFSQPLWLGKDGMGHLFLFKALDNALLYYLAYPHTELFVTYGNNVLASSIGDIGKDRVSHGYSGSLVSKGIRYEQRVVPWDRNAEETDEETPLLILQHRIIPPFSVWESVLFGAAGLSFMLILIWITLGS
ncbi:hypothetical protein [Dissulfurispira sp.]|uniref:hypothetical protein n=1 Tax=Dissulfurispira sp. TaxID=2817609 RepID=UPI002FDB0651